jgi:hypothetical protein
LPQRSRVVERHEDDAVRIASLGQRTANGIGIDAALVDPCGRAVNCTGASPVTPSMSQRSSAKPKILV